MIPQHLFFHIHYCKRRAFADLRPRSGPMARSLHHHVLLLFTGGTGRMVIDKKQYPIKKGMLFYICPEVRHVIELEQSEPGAFLSVHFSYAHVCLNDNRWRIKQEERRLMNMSARALTDDYAVEEAFRALAACWDAKQPGYEFAAGTLFQQLLLSLVRNIKKQNRNDAVALKVEKLIDYMHAHIKDKVTLPELAARVQLSPAYLSRSFKEITGYPVIGYFNKIKIDQAKELIIDGNRRIKDVAHALGFTDEFYFSRVFKKMEGVSPSEFYSINVHG